MAKSPSTKRPPSKMSAMDLRKALAAKQPAQAMASGGFPDAASKPMGQGIAAANPTEYMAPGVSSVVPGYSNATSAQSISNGVSNLGPVAGMSVFAPGVSTSDFSGMLSGQGGLFGGGSSNGGPQTTSGGLSGMLGGILGTQNNFQAAGAPIQNGTTPGQINQAYNQTQDALQQQQNFVNALQAQNGIANQSNVFGQQQNLANQLQIAANGGGPNPALAQLNQTTGQNVAQQAALMAGQRGAGANAGLIARQAAQQGANTQQQAVGQAATMAAQQQIAARQALQQQQANMGATAGTQVGQLASGVNNLNQAGQNEQQILQNANSAYNQGLVNMQSNINNANSATAQGNQNTSANLIGGLMNSAGSAAAMFAEGGDVPEDAAQDTAPVSNDTQNDTQNYPQMSHPSAAAMDLPQDQQSAAPQPQGSASSFNSGINSSAASAAQNFASGAQPQMGSTAPTSVQKDMSQKSGGGSGGGMSSMMGMAAMLADGGSIGYNARDISMSGGPELGTTAPTSTQTRMDFNDSFKKLGAKKAASKQPSSGDKPVPNDLGRQFEPAASGIPAQYAAPQAQAPVVGPSGNPFEGGPNSAYMQHLNNFSARNNPTQPVAPSQQIARQSPEAYGPPSPMMARGGPVKMPMPEGKPHNMKQGGHVPGKAKVQGNSYSNDTVPAVLSPGEIVIPRSITQGPNAAANAARFVHEQLNKKAKK